MSLGRLLAAGKSLMGARDGAGRYRVNKRVALPKFISPRNPFASARAEASSADVKPSARTERERPTVATAKAVTAAKERNDSRMVDACGQAARWLGQLGHKMNPTSLLTKRPGPAKSAVLRFARPPVQPELSLENIRVVRNDLSDADFEVVSGKGPVASVPGRPASFPLGECEPAGSTWNRLTTRFLGMGQT